MSTKVRTIGIAEGSIIAAIMTAHMDQMASTLDTVQLDEAGIVSCAKGWPMSTAIQARNAQANNATARIPIAQLGRAMRATVPGAFRESFTCATETLMRARPGQPSSDRRDSISNSLNDPRLGRPVNRKRPSRRLRRRRRVRAALDAQLA